MSGTEIVFHERALVGLVLVDPSVLDRTEIELAAYDWMDGDCSRLWPILCGMRRDGEPIADTRIVAERCSSVLDDPAVALGRLARDAGMFGQDNYHLQRLLASSEYRRLGRLSRELLRRCDAMADTPEDIREWASSQLFAAPSSRVTSQAIGDVMRSIVDSARTKKAIKKIETGLADLDEVIGGFRPGQLAILAARPSIGKSALASQIAVTAAQGGSPVLFVSLEMSATECVSRALATETGYSMKRILDGELDKYQLERADAAVDRYRETPLRIADRRAVTIERLSCLIRSETATQKLGLIVVDYLQLITGDRRKPRWELITEISNQLKSLALSECVPILALSQLNRDSEGETPKLSHLRDSGAIEQDADMVLLLHREQRSSTVADIIVAKNRNGPTGKISLNYDAIRFQFRAHSR
jgi:replicative DNA helicase